MRSDPPSGEKTLWRFISTARQIIDALQTAATRWENVLFFTAAAALLSIASQDLGVTWDETIYFQFSDSVAEWLTRGAPLDRAALNAHWAYSPYHNPHPPALKVFSAITALMFEGTLPFPLNYRLAHHLFGSLCITLVYAMLKRAFSRTAALSALAFAIFQPRVFGELLIASTDGPTAAAWLALTLLVWRISAAAAGENRSALWAFFFFIYALAAAVKFTAFLSIVPVVLYFLLMRNPRDAFRAAAAVVVALAAVIAFQPDQWLMPAEALRGYLLYPFTRSQIPITTFYLGRHYNFDLPWHYFDLMTIATLPVLIWVGLAGLFRIKPEERPLAWAAALPVTFWLVIVHMPYTPRHDGVRQFVSVYPLLGILAWIGARGLLEIFLRNRPPHATSRIRPDLPQAALNAGGAAGRRRVWVGSAAVALLTVGLWQSHPCELGDYNALVGGPKGAEKLGLEASYYFEMIGPDTLQLLNQRLPSEARLGMVPFWPDLFLLYQREGLLREDFSLVRNKSDSAEWVVVYRRRSLFEAGRYEALPADEELFHRGVSYLKLVRTNGA